MLDVRAVTKRYGGLLAVDKVSFTVERGEVVGYLGPNGSGKSTTVNMVVGLLEPSAGSILLDGCSQAEDPVASKHFQQLARLAGFAFTSAGIIAVVSYFELYRRFDRVTLRSFRVSRPRAGRWPVRGNSARAAVRDFTSATLRRSALHQGVVIGLSACGIALSMNILLRGGMTAWLRGVDMPRREILGAITGMPFALVFVLGIAARAALTLPIEPKANWVFRMTERDATRGDQLRAAERLVTQFAVLVPVALTLPIQSMVAGPRAIVSSAVTGVFGLLWVEALLREWRRIPFTCSYLPGKHTVAQASVVGLGVFLFFTTIGGALALAGLREPARVVPIIGVLCLVVFALRRRRRTIWRRASLMFDDELPDEIQLLHLRQ
jgi:ABC-type cobalamin/Fe3+-siderophores transport system ATPase subunit